MIDTRRLGHITFSTPDLAQQVDYYQHVIGLSVVERSATRCVQREGDLLLIPPATWHQTYHVGPTLALAGALSAPTTSAMSWPRRICA
jgi:catechol 2,3-dioxygenase-like lactoylglutathione lyase family enzyme